MHQPTKTELQLSKMHQIQVLELVKLRQFFAPIMNARTTIIELMVNITLTVVGLALVLAVITTIPCIKKNTEFQKFIRKRELV